MALFSPADLAELSGVVEELAFHDQYRLLREVVTYDDEHNRIVSWVEVEAGLGSLRNRDLVLAEVLIADRPTPTGQSTLQVPRESIITKDDRVEIGGQMYTVSGVTPLTALSLVMTAQVQKVIGQ